MTSNAQLGWLRNKRDEPHEQELEDEALALRRSGMTFDKIAKHQDRGRDKVRMRYYRAKRRESLTGTVHCPTCGHEL